VLFGQKNQAWFYLPCGQKNEGDIIWGGGMGAFFNIRTYAEWTLSEAKKWGIIDPDDDWGQC